MQYICIHHLNAYISWPIFFIIICTFVQILCELALLINNAVSSYSPIKAPKTSMQTK